MSACVTYRCNEPAKYVAIYKYGCECKPYEIRHAICDKHAWYARSLSKNSFKKRWPRIFKLTR